MYFEEEINFRGMAQLDYEGVLQLRYGYRRD